MGIVSPLRKRGAGEDLPGLAPYRLACMDEAGYVQISDLLKDVIMTSGEWISSLHIESLISQHQAVSEVAVIGDPTTNWAKGPWPWWLPRPSSPPR